MSVYVIEKGGHSSGMHLDPYFGRKNFRSVVEFRDGVMELPMVAAAIPGDTPDLNPDVESISKVTGYSLGVPPFGSKGFREWAGFTDFRLGWRLTYQGSHGIGWEATGIQLVLYSYVRGRRIIGFHWKDQSGEEFPVYTKPYQRIEFSSIRSERRLASIEWTLFEFYLGIDGAMFKQEVKVADGAPSCGGVVHTPWYGGPSAAPARQVFRVDWKLS